MDRMFEDFGFPSMRRFWGTPEAARFSPDIDVFERDGKFVVTADLPGMTKDDVKVDVSDEYIVIEGERKFEHEEREQGVYRAERSYGRFHREIPLPEGAKSETAKASFKNGVLEVTVEAPKLAASRRRIEITGETSSDKPEKSAA